MSEYLIETALLTHGLPSLSDQELRQSWNLPLARLAWLADGVVVSGGFEQYLPWRKSQREIPRLDATRLAAAQEQGLSGALTASATMQVAVRHGIPLVVTCGMGGVGPLPDRSVGSDLWALAELPVALIASAPKDVFDLAATIAWLHESGVKVMGRRASYCDGFLSLKAPVNLDGVFTAGRLQPPLLILNAIPTRERPIQLSELATAMLCGERAQLAGGDYHPAVNEFLSRASCGRSDLVQLTALLNNAALAAEL